MIDSYFTLSYRPPYIPRVRVRPIVLPISSPSSTTPPYYIIGVGVRTTTKESQEEREDGEMRKFF